MERDVHTMTSALTGGQRVAICFASGVVGALAVVLSSHVLSRTMTTVTSSDKDATALLVIDPYSDFISEGSKIWGRLKAVAEAHS